jgi:hypothetical protein
MTLSIVDFLNARLAEDEAVARAAAADAAGYSYGYPNDPLQAWRLNDEGDLYADHVLLAGGAYGGGIDELIGQHLVCHDPARVLREVTAKRRIMERHCVYGHESLVNYCAGCPAGDDSGYPDVELDDCPELQDMAWAWNDHQDWNPKWCPHVEGRHEVEVTEVQDVRYCYTNACDRCGQGDGWHYRDREKWAA